MKKIILAIIAILLIAIIGVVFFFTKNTAKNLKIGNNSSSQEIVEYILNISSYQTEIEIEVESNKNKNQYKLKQMYKGIEENWQQVLEPSNIEGLKISKNRNQLKIENTNLNVNSIYENYDGITSNCLDLSSFIQDYKENNQSSWKEENDKIIMKTKNKQEEKTLWVERSTGEPSKMQIKGINKNREIYIIYKKIEINKLV